MLPSRTRYPLNPTKLELKRILLRTLFGPTCSIDVPSTYRLTPGTRAFEKDFSVTKLSWIRPPRPIVICTSSSSTVFSETSKLKV
ncbi:hypothetical protein CGCA056_v009992 [Colletotrichum aenigma]|uniref:uncharacterized protein n=1 Tax=Colletotrichum aenigma TaxID=1215731 RepID=UPI00187274C7|nr:uncharacterized protein CGCA056_v009992 [Colletotrichum aenigma]KAF5518449.1 hypothetical protein CGCA056_v009992 [Colletotrichum aenigma]